MSIYQTLFLLYIMFFIISAISNHISYKKTKNKVYVYNTILYGAWVTNSAIQMTLTNHYLLGLAIAGAFFSNWAVVKILDQRSLKPTNFKSLPILSLILFLSYLALTFTNNFTLYSMPMAILSITPFFYISKKEIINFWKDSDYFGRFSIIVIGLNSLHMLDYPFFRLSPLTEAGFLILFLISFAYIFLINRITNQIYLDTVQKQITTLIEENGMLEKSKAVAGIMSSLSHEINNSLQTLHTCNEILTKQGIASSKIISLMTSSINNIKSVNSVFRSSSIKNEQPSTINNVLWEIESFLNKKNVFNILTPNEFIYQKTHFVNILFYITKMILNSNEKINVEKNEDTILISFENAIDTKKHSNDLLIAQTLTNLIEYQIVLEPTLIIVEKMNRTKEENQKK